MGSRLTAVVAYQLLPSWACLPDTQNFIMQKVVEQVVPAIATISRELNIEDVPKVEFLIIAVSDLRNDGEKNYRDVAKGTQRADDIWRIFCVHLPGPRVFDCSSARGLLTCRLSLTI